MPALWVGSFTFFIHLLHLRRLKDLALNATCAVSSAARPRCHFVLVPHSSRSAWCLIPMDKRPSTNILTSISQTDRFASSPTIFHLLKSSAATTTTGPGDSKVAEPTSFVDLVKRGLFFAYANDEECAVLNLCIDPTPHGLVRDENET
ncbi:hypothetical protein DFH06DRAFT_274839 [Mycena polygramma]|nr:hypothetical protein DFH06DRAFT_274839 [Mycena polygramma]